MAAQRFPLMNLTHVTFGKVIRFCSIGEWYHLSKLSLRMKYAIQTHLIRVKDVQVDTENESFRVELQNGCALEWTFEGGVNGHSLDVSIRNPRVAMAITFRRMKELFRIEYINTLKICVTQQSPSLRQHLILREIRNCKNAVIFLRYRVSPEDLKFLFEQVRIEDEFRIHANLCIHYQYDKPFSVAKTVIFGSGWNTYDRFIHRTLINANRVLFDKGMRPANGFRDVFQMWKQGLLPNLQIIEHDGYSDNRQFLEIALTGLDARNWDLERGNTQIESLIVFFDSHAKLQKFTAQSLQFQNAKDIIKTTDGTLASIIPATTDPHPDEFIFVVWSDWVPEEYRRVSHI